MRSLAIVAALLAVVVASAYAEEEGLYVNPKSYIKFHPHVRVMTPDEVAHIQECHDAASKCRITREAAETMNLEEDHIIVALADAANTDDQRNVIMRVGRITRDDTHAEFEHTKPLASEIIEEADIEVTSVPAVERLADGSTRRRRDLLSSLLGFLTSDQSYKLNDYITAYKKGPNFNIAVKSFKFQITLAEGIKVFELILRASAKASIGIKAETPKLLSYDVEFLDTGKITLGSFSFAAGPVPISISVVARNYLQAIVDLDSQFKLDYGFQAEGFVEIGVTYDKSTNAGFQTVFNRGFTSGRYGQITLPSWTLTTTIQDVAELSAQIGIGVGPARVDFFGPYFRLIPGVTLKVSPTTYDARFFIDSKVGIKGPDWQVLWFKIALEWGMSFRLYEVILETGEWKDLKFTQYITQALFDATPASIADASVNTLLNMDSTPPVPKVVPQTDYSVTVFTGYADSAGTDADVYMQIYSSSGDVSDKIWLDTTNDDFQNGQSDLFLIKGPAYPSISQIKFGHDSTGIAPGWFLDKAIIMSGATGTRYTAVARDLDKYPGLAGQWLQADGANAAVALVRTYTDSQLAQVAYKVAFRLGTFLGSGTSARLTITVTGSSSAATTDVIPGWDTFKKGNLTEITIIATSPLGSVVSLTVSHDGTTAKGQSEDPSFYVEQATVTTPDGTKTLFAPRVMLSNSPVKGVTWMPVSQSEYAGFTYRFIINVNSGSDSGTEAPYDPARPISIYITGTAGTRGMGAGYSLASGSSKIKVVTSDIDLGADITKVKLCNPFRDSLVTDSIEFRDPARQKAYTFTCSFDLGCIWGIFCSTSAWYCDECTTRTVGPIVTPVVL